MPCGLESLGQTPWPLRRRAAHEQMWPPMSPRRLGYGEAFGGRLVADAVLPSPSAAATPGGAVIIAGFARSGQRHHRWLQSGQRGNLASQSKASTRVAPTRAASTWAPISVISTCSGTRQLQPAAATPGISTGQGTSTPNWGSGTSAAAITRAAATSAAITWVVEIPATPTLAAVTPKSHVGGGNTGNLNFGFETPVTSTLATETPATPTLAAAGSGRSVSATRALQYRFGNANNIGFWAQPAITR